MSNVLEAAYTFSNLNLDTQLEELNATFLGENRAQATGAALESFVQYLFSTTYSTDDFGALHREPCAPFCYFPHANQPPDLMLSGGNDGDAIEVKKVAKMSYGNIQLNSSAPKNTLKSTDPKINNECRNCEDWTERDIVYAIGHIVRKKIKQLWFVFGNCWCDSSAHYTNITNTITESIIENTDAIRSNELARVNEIGRLGNSNLRVRAMWTIAHPKKIIEGCDIAITPSDYSLVVVMLREKFFNFSEEDRALIENSPDMNIIECTIQNPVTDPDNELDRIEAIIITA